MRFTATFEETISIFRKFCVKLVEAQKWPITAGDHQKGSKVRILGIFGKVVLTFLGIFYQLNTTAS